MPGIGDHFYCMDPMERDMATINGWYVNEGIACHVYPSYNVTSIGPWYNLIRLYNPITGDHFYTRDSTEADSAIRNSGYIREYLSNQKRDTYQPEFYPFFNAYVASTQLPGTVALYRVFNPSNGDHFYSTNEAEIIDAARQGYIQEGIGPNIAGFVFDQEQLGANGKPVTLPLFRLYKASDDPPFPSIPNTPPTRAKHNIPLWQFRDCVALEGNDVIGLDIRPLSPPANPTAGPEAEFHFGVSQQIKWTKEIRLYDSTGEEFGKYLFPRDPAGLGIGIENLPGSTKFVGRWPIARIANASFVFSKAGFWSFLGLLTGMYQLQLGDANFYRGKRITFTWLQD